MPPAALKSALLTAPGRADNSEGSHVRPRSLSLLAALLAVALTGAVAAPARAQDYPRLGLYGSMFGDGYPLWDASGVVNTTVLDQISRYHEVVLDASPITPYRPDVAAALRVRRPDIRLLAYVSGHNIWFAAQPDSLVHFPTRYWRTVRDLGGFLYNTSGGLYGSATGQLANVNLAKKDGTGRYVVAEAIADLFYDSIVRSASVAAWPARTRTWHSSSRNWAIGGREPGWPPSSIAASPRRRSCRSFYLWALATSRC